VEFKDHFSTRARLYAAYRPLYPPALFEFVSGLTRSHRVAVDCGTGSGQAAVGLLDHFDRVIGIDPSADQIDNAARRDGIEYRVARAEATGLPAGSADLVTAAQSLHWFDPPAFFAEARRLLAPGGALAVWGYGDPVLDRPELRATLHEYNRVRLAPYWFAERNLLLSGYRTLPFPLPFDEVSAPALELEVHWTLAELAGYLRTWSASARYAAERGIDPVLDAEKSLAADWGDPDQARIIRWPLYIRAGKIRRDRQASSTRGS
jgi:SAM-dependent methyltransferase